MVLHRVVKKKKVINNNISTFIVKRNFHKASFLDSKMMMPKQISQAEFLWAPSPPHLTREQENQIWNLGHVMTRVGGPHPIHCGLTRTKGRVRKN